ncbi:TetR family transcriptional regulator [Nocardioides sp. YIM 152588]|uniref:TetR/AcrR family transcriptional regulator n=1 Tax=Nocardioides sp. YIM 152588 TaxID=3158259 RepID=UPI0032E4FC32
MSTRDTVVVAAQRLLAVEPTASMAQIAAAAGVGRATVHRHFASREDLLREIGLRSLERWERSLSAAEAAAAGARDAAALRTVLVGMLERYVEDAEEFGIALTDPTVVSDAGLRQRSEALFAREIALYAAAQRADVLRSDMPARWFAHAVYGLLVGARDALVAGDVTRRDARMLVCTSFLEGGGVR